MPQREDEPGTSWMGEQFRVYFLIFVDFFLKCVKGVMCYVAAMSTVSLFQV